MRPTTASKRKTPRSKRTTPTMSNLAKLSLSHRCALPWERSISKRGIGKCCAIGSELYLDAFT
jgi:hypothetical protein